LIKSYSKDIYNVTKNLFQIIHQIVPKNNCTQMFQAMMLIILSHLEAP